MTFGLIANSRKELFWKTLPGLVTWFRDRKVPVLVSDMLAEHPHADLHGAAVEILPMTELIEKADMLIAFGGDGTMLRVVQLVGDRNIPILGVNVGGLGFLTEVTLEHFREEFDRILDGEYREEQRLVLKITTPGDPKPLYALNELVLDKGGSVRVIEIETRVNGQYLNSYIADGLILSTPTGSTGYSLSSGGPIVVPTADVVIINPICPHSLTNRPIILPADSVIEVVVRTEHDHFLIAADGQDVRHGISRQHLTVERAPFTARLVKPMGSDFFTLLQTKLRWGTDFRDKKRWSYNS